MKANNSTLVASQFVCLLALYLGFEDTAKAIDLSQERCNVFMESVCMTLPVGTSLSFEVPVDFARYRFMKNNEVYLWAYVKDSPTSVEGTQSFDKKVGDYRVKGFKSSRSGTARVDILFVPDAKSSAVVHVYADVDGARREQVAAALAGIRTCHRKSREELSCPLESKLGPSLVEWLSE